MASPHRRRSDVPNDSVCSHTFLRCVMIFLAMLTSICGALFLVLGGYLFGFKYYIIPLLHTELYMHCIYMMCFCGILCLLTGFFSCMIGSRCGIISFLLFMIVIVASEGLLVHTAVKYTALNAQNITTRLRNDVRYSYKEDTDIRWAVDKLQIEGKCCGAFNFMDYPENKTSEEDDDYSSETGRRRKKPQYLPDSCCINYKIGCAQFDHPSNVYYDGCNRIFEREVHNTMYFICTTAFAFIIVQSFTTLVTLCVCASWKNRMQSFDASSLKVPDQRSHLMG